MPHSWPSIAKIVINMENGGSIHCDGTLIDNRTVLSAAQLRKIKSSYIIKSRNSSIEINEFLLFLYSRSLLNNAFFVNSCFHEKNLTDVNVYLGLHATSDINNVTFEVKSPAVRRKVKNTIKVMKKFRVYCLE